jgi:hypothetical protein
MRIMTHILLAIALLATLAFAPAGNDAGNFKPGSEPYGFRGIRWGTPIAGLEGMIKVWEDGDSAFYEKKGDLLEIGGAKLHSIRYVFWQDRFIEARIVIPREYSSSGDEWTHFRTIRNICFERFGEQRKPLLGHEEYSWLGDTSWVRLVGYDNPGFLRLNIGSTEGQNEKKVFEETKKQEKALEVQKAMMAAKGF